MKNWEMELKKISHRSYTEASLIEKAGPDSIFNERESSQDVEYKNIGMIKDIVPNEYLVIDVKNAFTTNDELEVISYQGLYQKAVASDIQDLLGQKVEKTKPNTLVKIPYVKGVDVLNMVRMRV